MFYDAASIRFPCFDKDRVGRANRPSTNHAIIRRDRRMSSRTRRATRASRSRTTRKRISISTAPTASARMIWPTPARVNCGGKAVEPNRTDHHRR